MVTRKHPLLRALTTTWLLGGVALAGCAPDTCKPPSCDVRQSACRRVVMTATACLRGERPREVPTRVVRVEDYVALQKASLDYADKVHFEAVAAGWALLGLQRERDYEEVLDEYYDTVGAYYDAVEDAVTILHRGAPLDSDGMVATLVHEFSHALQHDAVDEAGPRPALLTTDARIARSAMFEGDATRSTDHALVLSFGADPKGPAWSKVYDEWRGAQTAAYADEALRITLAGRYFVYAFGATFAEKVAAEAGSRYLRQMYGWMRQPPQSTLAIDAGPDAARREDERRLEAYERWPAGSSVPSAASVEADAAPDPASDAGPTAEAGAPEYDWQGPDLLIPEISGHRLLDADSLGSFVLEAYAAHLEDAQRRAGMSAERLRETASELRADSLTVWQSARAGQDEPRTVVVLRLVFDDESVARRWFRAFERVNPGQGSLRVDVDGEALTLIASDDESWLGSFSLDELGWLRLSPARVAAQLYPSAEHAGAEYDRRASWKSRFSRGCVRHPGALFFAP